MSKLGDIDFEKYIEDYKNAYETVMIVNKMLEQENKQLKEDKKKAWKYLKTHTMIGKCKEYYELLEILGDKEWQKIKMANIHYEIKPSFTTRKLKELEQENKQLKEQLEDTTTELFRANKKISEAIEYIKEYGRDKQLEEEYLMNAYNLAMYNITLLEILGDKENEI